MENNEYDVFISHTSDDSNLAKEIYDFLKENGLHPFLYEVSIPNGGNSDYREEISRVLNKCQHLIVFCTKPEYALNEWVKFEWGSFLNEKLSNRKCGNLLSIVADNISFDELPFDLRQYQTVKFSKYKDSILFFVKNKQEESYDKKDASTKVIKVGNIKFNMIRVEGGTFQIGAEDGYKDSTQVHNVTLSDYYIGETVVTMDLWYAVMKAVPANLTEAHRTKPVTMVNWKACQDFINKLNERTGLKFALPTEAQWEYAARGGNKSKGCTYSGSNVIFEVAWFENNSGRTSHQVGGMRPNELGLFDMSGNVWELCQDWYEQEYHNSSQNNPTGPITGKRRVIRGGSYNSKAGLCRIFVRDSIDPEESHGDRGFRLVLLDT